MTDKEKNQLCIEQLRAVAELAKTIRTGRGGGEVQLRFSIDAIEDGWRRLRVLEGYIND